MQKHMRLISFVSLPCIMFLRTALHKQSSIDRVNNALYISGFLGTDPVHGQLVPAGVESQCRQVLTNIEAVLQAAGPDFDNGTHILYYFKLAKILFLASFACFQWRK